MAALGSVSKTSQVGYEAALHTPDLNYLAKVAEAGVDEVFVMRGHRKQTFVAQQFNWDLASELFEIIEEWASKRRKKTPASVKVHILKILYARCCEEGKIDKGIVLDTLKLAS